jgi:hypothetical protein
MMLKKTLHKAISKKAHRDLYISWETSLQCVKNIYTNIVAKKTIS